MSKRKTTKATTKAKTARANKPPSLSPRAQREQMVSERMDGWASALLGYNTAKDKRTYTTFQAPQTNWVENLEMWRGDDLAGRIVETIPNEMMRQGWELCVEGEDGKDISSDVMQLLEDLGCDDKLWTALCCERALGGAGVLLGGNDLRGFSSPLDLTKLKELNFLEVFEPSELPAEQWQRDPTKRGFGSPLTYRLNPMASGGASRQGEVIHESRLLLFPGIRVSRRQVTTQAGWGDAVLTRCRETLRDFQTTWTAAGLLAADFAQSVWKIKGLAEIIALDQDKALQTRIAMMELARSSVRATVIDGEAEEFERKSTPITGLPELLDRFATRLAAAADMPVTLLMGQSPAGLNATGESDIRTFYDRIKSMQHRKLRPALEKLCRAAFSVLGYEEPEDWYIEFHPLWQPTEQEMAQTRLTQASVDSIYVGQLGILGAEEVRKARFGGRKWSGNTQVDPDSPLPEPEPGDDYSQLMGGEGGGPPPDAPPPSPEEGALPDEEKAKTIDAERVA